MTSAIEWREETDPDPMNRWTRAMLDTELVVRRYPAAFSGALAESINGRLSGLLVLAAMHRCRLSSRAPLAEVLMTAGAWQDRQAAPCPPPAVAQPLLWSGHLSLANALAVLRRTQLEFVRLHQLVRRAETTTTTTTTTRATTRGVPRGSAAAPGRRGRGRSNGWSVVNWHQLADPACPLLAAVPHRRLVALLPDQGTSLGLHSPSIAHAPPSARLAAAAFHQILDTVDRERQTRQAAAAEELAQWRGAATLLAERLVLRCRRSVATHWVRRIRAALLEGPVTPDHVRPGTASDATAIAPSPELPWDVVEQAQRVLRRIAPSVSLTPSDLARIEAYWDGPVREYPAAVDEQQRAVVLLEWDRQFQALGAVVRRLEARLGVWCALHPLSPDHPLADRALQLGHQLGLPSVDRLLWRTATPSTEGVAVLPESSSSSSSSSAPSRPQGVPGKRVTAATEEEEEDESTALQWTRASALLYRHPSIPRVSMPPLPPPATPSSSARPRPVAHFMREDIRQLLRTSLQQRTMLDVATTERWRRAWLAWGAQRPPPEWVSAYHHSMAERVQADLPTRAHALQWLLEYTIRTPFVLTFVAQMTKAGN